MGIIKVLDESVSNMIAAGEVVENPVSKKKKEKKSLKQLQSDRKKVGSTVQTMLFLN